MGLEGRICLTDNVQISKCYCYEEEDGDGLAKYAQKSDALATVQLILKHNNKTIHTHVSLKCDADTLHFTEDLHVN